MKEKSFDGIIIPCQDEKGFKGEIIGIVSRELDFGPPETDNMIVNIATPSDKELSRARLFWLENCAESGPYSKTACYYWLMPYFSKLHERFASAARVRPPRGINPTYEYDVISWYEGKPVELGHQYETGRDISNRLGTGDFPALFHVVKAWEEEKYDKFAKTLKEIIDVTVVVTDDIPYMEFQRAKRKLEIQARNAGWSYKWPLIKDAI